MQQVLINTPATLRETWYEDGVAVDPGTVTVTLTRADGTALATGAATTAVAAFTGDTNLLARAYNLPISSTGLLDSLTLTWVSATKGTLTSYVAIPGGFYFSIAEALALPELAEKTAAEIAETRTLAEQAFEDAAGVAFVPRYQRVTLGAMHGAELRLPKLPVRALRSVSEITGLGGTAADVVLSGLALTRSGIYRQAGWTAGPGNVTVGYEYGYDRPPERVARAVLLLAKNWLVNGPIDDRATGIPAGEAGGVITLATPGVRDDVFGLPEVDATLKQYGIKKSGVQSIPLTPDSNSYYRSPESAWHGW